jgi:hypothetical protein
MVFRALSRDAAYPIPSRAGLAALTLGLVMAAQLVPATLGAEASPMLIDPLDPRAEGEGPGLVGAPLVAALAVIALGIAAAVATALYIRLTQRP